MANANATAVNAIKAAAQKYGLDPQAMIAVARVESGLRPDAVGDGGHAFGLFQFNNAGGVITGQANPERYLDPGFNAMEAARHIASIKGARGARGKTAIELIVNKFERPANKGKEIATALSFYGKDHAPAPTVGLNNGQINSNGTQTAPNGLLANNGQTAQGINSNPLESLLQSAMSGSDPSQQENGSYNLLRMLTAPQEEVPAPTLADTPQAPPALTAPLPSRGGKSPLDPTNNATVRTALKALGTDYSWGGGGIKGATRGTGRGANTVGFDCSGLVQYAVKAATGLTIPRVAADQYAASEKVPTNKMQPGDIIAFGSANNIHHIGIYMGNGKFIESPHTGAKVRVSKLSSRSDIVGAGRFPTGK